MRGLAWQPERCAQRNYPRIHYYLRAPLEGAESSHDNCLAGTPMCGSCGAAAIERWRSPPLPLLICRGTAFVGLVMYSHGAFLVVHNPCIEGGFRHGPTCGALPL